MQKYQKKRGEWVCEINNVYTLTICRWQALGSGLVIESKRTPAKCDTLTSGPIDEKFTLPNIELFKLQFKNCPEFLFK